MNLARPLCFPLLVIATATLTWAADDNTKSPDGKSEPSVNRQADPYPLAPLKDEICYTLRMYKAKPTERLSTNESGTRGYSTCELASNYQVRSAVAHDQSTANSSEQKPQK